MIIGVMGLAGAGKDEFTKILQERHGFKKYDFSKDVLEEIARKRRLNPTKANLSDLGDQIRDNDGRGILAEMLLKKIGRLEGNIVISGFRSPEELDYIRNEALDFYLIEIYADPLVRYNRKREVISSKVFFERDRHDMETKGMGKVIRMADFIIKNNSDHVALESQIYGLLIKLGFKHD
jgi:dephospho-CoA kinase